MKKILQTLLLAVLVTTGSLAYAGSDKDWDFDFSDIEELETEPFAQIDGKWEVEIELEDDEYTFYVYNIDSEDELFEEIADALESQYGIDASASDVEGILEFDEDEIDEEEDEDEDEDEEIDELEIEAEPYKSIDGKWEVEFESDEKEVTFYVYNIDSEDELVSEITDYVQDTLKLDISEDEVADVLEFDEDDIDEDYDEGEDEDDDYDDKDYDKDEKDDVQKNTSDRDAQILALQEQITLLLELVIKLLSQQAAVN